MAMGGGSSSKSKLGKIALQQRRVHPRDLRAPGADAAPITPRDVAPIGSRLSALAIPDGLAQRAAEHDVPPVVLGQLVLRLGQLVLVPEDIALEHTVLPFEATRDRVLLAMLEPWRSELVEEMEFLTGKTAEVYLAERSDLERAVAEAYAAHAAGETLYAGHAVSRRDREAVGLGPPPGAPLALAVKPVGSEASGEVASGPREVAAAAVHDVAGPPEHDEELSGEWPAAAHGADGPPPPAVGAAGSDSDAEDPTSVPSVVAVAAPTVVGIGRHRAASPAPDGNASPAPTGDASPTATPARAAEDALGPDDPVVTADADRPAADDDDDPAERTAEPRLDVAFSEPPSASASPELTQDLAHAHLLVADAHGDTADALSAALAATRLRITCVNAGGPAMAALRDGDPNLLVLDTRLPEVNGLDLCRRLRASERYAELPIVLFSDLHTGWRFEADLRECFGIDALFEKPLDMPRLTRVLVGLLTGAPVEEAPGPLSEEGQAQLDRGVAAFEQGDLEGAIEHLEAGAHRDPQAFELQYHLGLLYGRRDSLFSAIQALETAARLQRRHFSTLKNLAVVYQRVGFRRKTLETWERAMWVAPDEATRTSIKDHMKTLL